MLDGESYRCPLLCVSFRRREWYAEHMNVTLDTCDKCRQVTDLWTFAESFRRCPVSNPITKFQPSSTIICSQKKNFVKVSGDLLENQLDFLKSCFACSFKNVDFKRVPLTPRSALKTGDGITWTWKNPSALDDFYKDISISKFASQKGHGNTFLPFTFWWIWSTASSVLVEIACGDWMD